MSSGNRGYRKRPYYNKFNGGYNNNYYYGGYKKKYYKYKNYQNEEKDYVPSNENNENNIEKVTKSDEKGFTGAPDTWFSDEEFLKHYQVIQIWKIKKIIISTLIHHIIFMSKCLKIEKEQELIKMQF